MWSWFRNLGNADTPASQDEAGSTSSLVATAEPEIGSSSTRTLLDAMVSNFTQAHAASQSKEGIDYPGDSDLCPNRARLDEALRETRPDLHFAVEPINNGHAWAGTSLHEAPCETILAQANENLANGLSTFFPHSGTLAQEMRNSNAFAAAASDPEHQDEKTENRAGTMLHLLLAVAAGTAVEMASVPEAVPGPGRGFHL